MIHLVMGFRNKFRSGLHPVNRIKHVIDTQGATTAGANLDIFLAVAKDAPVLGTQTDVETGCTINGVYIHVETNATSSAALANAYMIVVKNPGGNITLPAPNTVGTDDNKRFVIHQEMVMLQQVTNSNPRTLFNGVVVIPRGYRRFAPNDQLIVRVQSPGTNNNWCLQAHYKEFR